MRSIFYEGSSSFGNGYHYLDINDSAAILSRAVGAPVRLQLMRWDEQGWNKYGPAIMHDMRAGIDASGNIVAFEAVAFAQAGAGDSAAKQLLGDVPAAPGAGGTNAENLGPMYKVAINALGNQGYRLISKTQTQAMGMFQNGPLRAPSGPQTSFATEQIIDMLAEAAKHGSVRVPREEHARRTASARAASGRATRACSPRPSTPRRPRAATCRTCRPRTLESGKVVSGWGMAIGTHNDSYGAGVAYVSVNKETGKITVNHLWAGQDSGFAINPELLMNRWSATSRRARARSCTRSSRSTRSASPAGTGSRTRSCASRRRRR